MARKGIFRRNTLIIGGIALGAIILFGLVANVSEVFFTGFEAIPFTVPLPLDIFPDRSVDCRIWVQGDIIDVTGEKTDIGFKTETFNPRFSLELINPLTEEVVRDIDTEIRIRCDPFLVGGISSINSENFRLTGGSLEYFWVADEQDGTTRFVTSTTKLSISPSNNVLQTCNGDVCGSGVTIAKPKISGSTIDRALTSTQEVYFTQVTLVVKATPEFRSDLLQTDEFATVSLLAGIAKLKIFNEVVDPPKPTSQIVNIVNVITNPVDLTTDTKGATLEVRVRLPQWDPAEGGPTFDILRPSTGGKFIEERSNIPITVKKLVDSSTNTYEFSITRVQLPDNMIAGSWAIHAEHQGRTGVDNELFTVVDPKNQKSGETTRSTEKSLEEKCAQLQGDAKVACLAGEAVDPGEEGGPFNFLNFNEFIGCLSGSSQDAVLNCLNDTKFYPIFGIFAIIIIISAAGSRRS